MNTPGATELGGQRQVVTVLFSDIRGFTSRSEQMEPEQVTQFLNLYLEKMVNVVFSHGGTIDKYIGDGIMAIWNWPYPQPDHALRAAQAAVQMQQEVALAAEKWQEMGFPVLRVGIGIHSGHAVLGNIGAPQRMERTAIGDTVNVASRLESLTKEKSELLGSSILISEPVREAIQQSQSDIASLGFDFAHAGETVIRGRTEAIKLYAMVAAKSVGLEEGASC
jgi:adenylate cyclase